MSHPRRRSKHLSATVLVRMTTEMYEAIGEAVEREQRLNAAFTNGDFIREAIARHIAVEGLMAAYCVARDALCDDAS